MAEEVEIGNVGGSGGVASEVTLQKLVTAMNALARQQGVKSDQLQKAQEAYARSLKKSTQEVQNNTSAFDNNTDAVNTNTSSFSKIGTVMVKALKGVASSALGLTKELVVGGDELSDFTGHIPLIGGALTSVVRVFEGARDNFRELSEVGAGFNNSIVEITAQAGLSGLTLEKFKEIVGANSESMLFFGGTVSEGARGFTQLARQMRTGNVGSGLLALGFTVKDLNEGLITTTALEARVTGQRIRDEQQLVSTSQSYLKELDKLAKLTGQSRKQAQDQMMQNAQEANVARMLADLDKEGRKNFQANLGFVSSELPLFAGAFKDLADGIPQTELGTKLAALVPGFGDLAEASATGTISQEELIARLKEMGPDLENFAKTFDAASTTALMDKDAGFAALFGGMFQFREFMAKTFDPKLAEDEQKRREAITQALQQFETVIGEVRTKVFEALLQKPDGVGHRLQKFLESLTQEDINNFNKAVGDFIDRFGQIIANPKEEGKKLLKDIGDSISSAFAEDGFGTKLIDSITPLFEKLISKMEETFVNSFLARTLLGIDKEEVAKETLKNKGADALTDGGGGAENLADLIQKFASGQIDNQVSTKLKLRDDLLADTLGEELSTYFRELAEQNQNSFLRFVRKDGVEMMAEMGRIGKAIKEGTATEEQKQMLGQALQKLQEGGFFLNEERSLGTFGAIGKMTEPKNTIAKIHAGERVLNPQEAASYNSGSGGQKGMLEGINQLNSTMNQATGLLNEIRLLSKKQVTGIKGMAPAIQ